MAKERANLPRFSHKTKGVITVRNGNELMMEGVEKIVLCSEERIDLKGRQTVSVVGEKLQLRELGNDNMAVAGRILRIEFSEVRL
ncbi:MAG: YabP/YqfC family sporulation protein [Clostridia bacterium]|nr:YabP/YqfC family sporulation protein [Clostridia bacterium]